VLTGTRDMGEKKEGKDVVKKSFIYNVAVILESWSFPFFFSDISCYDQGMGKLRGGSMS